MEPLPLIVIVGPTASGKTGLAIRMAKRYNGEVISADSRAIYKGMDIGSAKPDVAGRQGVPHWGFDMVEPGERFTAADFKQYANEKIAEIRARGHLPIIAGGTGLYVNAVIFDYEFPAEPAPGEREKWEAVSLGALHDYCIKNNIKLPENKQNKRYVINAILRNGYALKMKKQPFDNTIVVGIATTVEQLKARISLRTEQIFADGVIDEAKILSEKYGWNSEAMKANIYPLIRRQLSGELTLSETKELCSMRDWHLAKRQMTWFKRNEYIKWLPLNEAYTYIAHTLDNLNNL